MDKPGRSKADDVCDLPEPVLGQAETECKTEMMTIAQHPNNKTQDEREGQLEFFTELKELLDTGNIDEAKESVARALKMLERELRK